MELRKHKMNVYCGGTFDLFHAGHVNLLEQAREIAGTAKLTVGLNTDRFIKDYKGTLPVCSYDERRIVLEACRYVDQVIPNIGGADSREAVLMSGARTIVVGNDWERKDYNKQMGFTQQWLDHHDIWVVFVPYYEPLSTTILKKRMV